MRDDIGKAASDLRDIRTRMEAQDKLQSERDNSLRESVEAMKRRQELQQYELQEFQKTLMRLESMVK